MSSTYRAMHGKSRPDLSTPSSSIRHDGTWVATEPRAQAFYSKNGSTRRHHQDRRVTDGK